MITLSELRIPCGEPQSHIAEKAARQLHLKRGRIPGVQILRHSIDCRRKPDLMDVYTVAVELTDQEEASVLRRRIPHVSSYAPDVYTFPGPQPGAAPMTERPVVIGAGPAGLFAAYMLALHGYSPLLLERGRAIEQRTADVEAFWRGGALNPSSNIQFGEGGAGTFSDGKLNTMVKDRQGRNAEVLRIFTACGAPEEIRYEGKPHIGTDRLREVIVNLRREIIRLGGEVQFETRVTGFVIERGVLTGIRIVRSSEPTDSRAESETVLSAHCAILAPGHSARDLFEELDREGIPLEAKDFAIGYRVLHPQAMINRNQYGVDDPREMKRLRLPPSSYKLTEKVHSGRGVYSFCMCPGGYVVNASSEPGRLAVNGMSFYDRGSLQANSAIVVTVSPKDFGGTKPLDGVAFQRKLEEHCYQLAGGYVPVERFLDFEQRTPREKQAPLPDSLCIRGAYAPGELHTLLPESFCTDFVEGMHAFDRKIRGFAGPDCYLAGLESRTSSPIRIPRDGHFQSIGVRGLYPCGEGAGYAGGIMSAAMDGIKTAEAVGNDFLPFHAENKI